MSDDSDQKHPEPEPEDLGELDGEAVNEAASQHDLGGALGATHDSLKAQSVFQSLALPSVFDGLKAAEDAIASETSLRRISENSIQQLFNRIEQEHQGITKAFEGLLKTSSFMGATARLSRTIDWSEFFRGLPDLRGYVIPDNLIKIDDQERLDDVCRIADEDGTSLAWAPRTEIVEKLLDAADMDERDSILQQRALDVISDVETSLTRINHPDALQWRAALEEACTVGRHKAYIALQATATNVLDHVVNEWLAKYLEVSKRNSRKHFKQRSVEELKDASLGEIRLLLIGGGVETAFLHWKEEEGGLQSYSRNGTVHFLASASRPAHAIRALLLAQALLRWMAIQSTAEETDD